MSAGGFGHVPIPLVKGEIAYRSVGQSQSRGDFHWDIGFVGNNRPLLSRYQIIGEVKLIVDSINQNILSHSSMNG